MLLTIDIGNTHIKLGVYDGQTLAHHWRVTTERYKLADEYGVLLYNLFKWEGMDITTVNGCVISCVVPPLTSQFCTMSRHYLHVEPVVVGTHIETGLRYQIDAPHELGSDRIANALAAYYLYDGPVIAIALGTATAFDVVTAEGVYIGGAIAPGIAISADALFRAAARLYQVELVRPPQVIGKNTVHYIQSGLILGYAGLIEGMVRRMQQELDAPCKVVATGGLAETIANETEAITVVEPLLTLEGLRFIYNMNSKL